MSFEPPPPVVAVAFGGYGVPQSDVVECRVHLGCTKEVSSFTLTLQNWGGKYGPSGSIPLSVGMDGVIGIGRGNRCPQIITCRIEGLRYESKPTEHYVHLSGRCWGERLFRRVFTGVFENMKGEEIVKHLLDYYVGLSHNRGGTELVEATDTTYTRLEYENTPVWDVIRYIADSADKNGVIGFDFRVAPDGEFEFFPRNSKTSPVNLIDAIEEYEYCRDIHSVRNKITVYGTSVKKLPEDANDDGYTESTAGWISNGNLTLNSGHVAEDGQKKYSDSWSVEANIANAAVLWMQRSLPSMRFGGADGFKAVSWWMNLYYAPAYYSGFRVRLQTDTNNYFEADLTSLVSSGSGWRKYTLDPTKPTWTRVGNPSWNSINGIRFIVSHTQAVQAIQMLIDHLVFSGARYSAVQEDTASQSLHGLRELVEVDEELYSDNECLLRAKALLDHYRNPAESLIVKSTVIDYGDTPILAGDRVYVELPDIGVSGYFRVESVEYHVDAGAQTLWLTLKLGREAPLLADYLYALKAKTEHLSRRKAPA
ncbi:MAG: hypothetical protein QXL91_02475 [Candidatus Bathyarchaeia archaeon]